MTPKKLMGVLLLGTSLGLAALPHAAVADVTATVENAAKALEPRVISWRRDFHQNPELSNRELRTSKIVAEHLKKLKLDRVQTGVAHTGVIGVLKGKHPGPVIALRADMDALPVTEEVDLPFASRVRTTYNDQEVGVMHACGHDAHIAILMGVAELLSGMRDEIHGTIVFIFQPAEEGAPAGETGGASLIIEEGLFPGEPAAEAIFGLHVWPNEAGTIAVRAEGAMAASDRFSVTIQGRQTHGSSPWLGVDPITIAGQMLTAIQMIPSRQLDVTRAPSVITVGHINGGIRYNIIPDKVQMNGTIRTFDVQNRQKLLKDLERTVRTVAETGGGTAVLEVSPYAPAVYNDPKLLERVMPSLQKAVGKPEKVMTHLPVMGSEDFSYYQEKVPGVFFFLGVNKENVAHGEAAANHSPLFYVNEAALVVGVKALSFAALDYLRGAPSPQ